MNNPSRSFASSLPLAVTALATVLALAACGDDSGGTGTGGAGSTGADGGSTSAPSSSSSGNGPSSSSSSSGDGGGGAGPSSTSSGEGGTGGSGDGGGGGAPVGCDDIPDGPFEPTLFTDVLGGSEDIALDGLGNLAGKSQGDMVLVASDRSVTVLAEGIPDAYGTRFRNDGALIVALPGEGEVIAISPEGDVETLSDTLSGPNGIHVDSTDVVWVTELGAGRIQRIEPGQPAELFLGGGDAPAVNGIYVDEARGIVFFTNYSAGEITRIDLAGTEEPVLVAEIPGTNLDGLTLDACGNVYAVDQGGGAVYRVRTDAVGDATAEPELIAQLPSNVANAQFGRGTGFSPTTLYAAGNPGDVYAIEVGVEGAEQVGP